MASREESNTGGNEMAKRKVTVVGAGNVGGTTAQRLAERNYADVVLVDIVEGLPQGKALDILESGPILGYDSNVTGANDYEETAGSDVVVITSGSPRKPGMSRDDLLKTNQNIVASVTEEVVEHSPETILVVVANPLDAMCHVAMETSDFPRERGAEIVGLLQSGSAYYAPSAAAAEMVDAILLDQKRILPCAAYLQGEYGIDDLFVGVPVKLGASGVEDIIELGLTEVELRDLNDSADSVRDLVQVLHG